LIIEKRLVDQWRKYRFFGSKYTDWNIWRNILEKCHNVSAVQLMRDDIVYPDVYRLMEDMAKYLPHIQSYEVHSDSSESHTDLYGLIDRIVAFKELRHLSIDCPLVYGDSNPCANAMNKVALNCPHIQSLSFGVNCFVAPNLINIFKAMQWFAKLERLHLGLYNINWDEPRQYSVKPLLECRRLKWVSLESAPDFEFIDVDKLRALVPRVTITKGAHPQDAWRHLPRTWSNSRSAFIPILVRI